MNSVWCHRNYRTGIMPQVGGRYLDNCMRMGYSADRSHQPEGTYPIRREKIDMGSEEPGSPLDYTEKKAEFINFLDSKDNAIVALATSEEGRVLARSVLIASHGLELYFFTWGHSRKCAQIRANPKVALCKDSVQIEGVAEILGDLVAEDTKEYTDVMRKKFPEAIARWEDRPGMVIVRVRPRHVVFAGSSDEPSLEFLDLENETAHSERWAHY
jgi:general stress protein 26